MIILHNSLYIADSMGVKERLKTFRKHTGLKIGVFEERCGVSNGYINNIRKSIGDNILNNVLKEFPELNRNWLLFGEGNMLNDTADEKPSVLKEPRPIYNVKDDVTMSREVFDTLANLAKCVESQQKTIEKLVGNMDEEDTAGSA